MRPRLGSFPLQLITVVALPLLILLTVVAFGGVTFHQRATRNMVTEQDVRAVRGAAASLSERLEQKHDMLAVLAERVQGGEPAADVLGTLGDWPELLFDGGVAFYSADGNLLDASPQADVWKTGLDMDEVFQTTQVGGTSAFFPIVHNGVNDTRVTIAVSAPVYPSADEAGVRAVGVTSLDNLGLSAVLSSLRAPSGASVYLATDDGLILYHSDPAQVGETVSHDPHMMAPMRMESGADFTTDMEGRRVIESFAPVAAAHWSLVRVQPWDNLIDPIMRYSAAAPLVLLPGILIAVAVVWFGIREIVKPLQQLGKRANALSWGDYGSIEEPVGGIEEIEQLQESLRHMADRVQSAQAGMRHYIAAITQAQEDERARLARELHDHMVQALIALDHRAQVLKRHLPAGDPSGHEVLAELRAMIAESINDLRRIIRGMRPIFLEELGLAPALEMLARDLNLVSDIPIRFEKCAAPRRLPPDHEMALYRMAQEALTNARKHSQATNIWLSVSFEPDEVVVKVRDDGRGFSAPQRITDLSANGHFGLMGMHERATLIGAHLQIESEPGQSTTITIRAPVAASE